MDRTILEIGGIVLQVEINVTGKPTVSLELLSKFTVICGKFSGEGKSEFVNELQDAKLQGRLSMKSSFPVSIATLGTIEDLIELETRHIFILDELSTLDTDVLNKISKSKHIFISICRSFPKGIVYSYHGMYSLHRTNDWFTIEKLNVLPVTKHPEGITHILTESAKDRSEFQLLSAHWNLPITAANGLGKIAKQLKLLDTNGLLVFMDLANVNTIFNNIKKNVKHAQIFDYQSFEDFLLNSEIFKNSRCVDIQVWDFVSLEIFAEKKLELISIGGEYEYTHGKSLPVAYLDSDNFYKIFSNEPYLMREIDKNRKTKIDNLQEPDNVTAFIKR